MEHKDYYKYYVDQNNYISKNYKIHSLLYIIDMILTYLSTVDGIGKKFNNSEEKLYSLPNILAKLMYEKTPQYFLFIILIGFIFVNIFLFSFYNKLFKKKKSIYLYINYNEIIYLRFLPIFYFTIITKLKNDLLFFGIIIMIIFICIAEYHFYFYHSDFFCPDFTLSPYDNFSKIFDQFLLIVKFCLPFSLKNQSVKNLSITVSYTITAFLMFFIIYLIIFKPFYLILNLNLNLIKISCHSFFFLMFSIFLTFRGQQFTSTGIIIFEVTSIISVIFLVYSCFIPFRRIQLNKFNNENIYYFFLFYYNKNYEFRLNFLGAFNEHYNICKDCQICRKIKLSHHQNVKKINPSEIINNRAHFDFLTTLTFIMECYITSGFQGLSKNKRILLSLLNTLSDPIFRKNNIFQYLNLYTIYKQLGKANEAEMEKVTLLMSELHSVNQFIEISSELLNNLNDIFRTEPSSIKIEKILDIVDNSAKLKSKTFRKNLFSNKEVKEILYQLTICSILYEEIFNEPLVKINVIQIREHYQDLEETLNLFESNKQITFKLDIFNGKMEFLRSGQEFHNYIHSDFYDIFPRDLLEYQKNLLRSYLYNPEVGISGYPKSMNIKLVYIIDKIKRLYGIIHLNFTVLLQKEEFNIIIVDGLYYITSNNLISFIKNGKEYFYGSSIEYSDENENKLSSFKNFLIKNNISEKDIKLSYSFIQEDKVEFKVYNYGEEYKEESKSLIEYTRDEINEERIFANMKAYDESSVQGSLASINSTRGTSYLGNFKGRRTVQTKKESNNKFFLYQRLMIIFICILFILTIIELVQKEKKKKSLISNYGVFTSFRLVSRTYFYMVSSFRAPTCLLLPGNEKCRNYLEEYNTDFNLSYSKSSFDMIRYLLVSNELKIRHESDYSNQLWNNIYHITDKKTRLLFEEYINYYTVSFIDKNGFLNINIDNITFMDAFKATINSFTVIANSGSNYVRNPFFVIDLNTYYLLNYNNPKPEDWRFDLYNLIINYENFCDKFDFINSNFNDKLLEQLSNYQKLTIVYLSINLFIELSEVIIIILYIYSFEMVMVEIYVFVKKRVSTTDFSKTYKTKLKHLKLLLQIYAIHPKKVLEDLQDLYSSHKKKVKEEKKNKATEKTNAFERNYSSSKLLLDLNTNNQILKSVKNTSICVFYQLISNLTFSISLIIFLIFLFLWINCFAETKCLFKTISDGSQIESYGYQFFSFYQNRIYTTIKTEEKSKRMKTDFIKLILSQEEEVSKVKRNQNKIEKIFKRFYKDLGLTCDTFYDSVQDVRVVQMDKENPNDHFTEKIIEVCKGMNFLSYENIEFIMQKTFSLIYRGMMSIENINNENRELFLTNITFYFDSAYYNNLLIRMFRTGVNKLIFTPSINYYMNQITLLFIMSAVVEFIFEVTFLLVVMFLFVFKINKLYKKMLRVSKIIKIFKD